MQIIDKYGKVNPDAIYKIVSLDFVKDSATIRGDDNPLAFTVEAKDLKMLLEPKESDESPDESPEPLKQESPSLEDLITEQSEIVETKEKPERIVIKTDFNEGLNLLSTPDEQDETNSGDEDSEIKKIS